MNCCICYEKCSKAHPLTPCCRQPIHTKCLQRCDTRYLSQVSCPMCRTMIQKYPMTRGCVGVFTTLVKMIEKSHEEKESKIMNVCGIIDYVCNQSHLIKVLYPNLITLCNDKINKMNEELPLCDRHEVAYIKRVEERYNKTFNETFF